MHPLFKIILYPFSFLYQLITGIRNTLFDRNILKSVQFDLPVIGVGNLSVGGTGKTPMVEYLLRLLKNDCKLATLSRGYGRKTRGFHIATDDDNAQTIGDEPYQIFNKFKPDVVVTVGEERIVAVPQILYRHPEVQVIILDDAFQHRAIRPSIQVLLTDYNNLFYKDILLPGGRLRESREGAKRADIVVITKCPSEITIAEMEIISNAIKKYCEGKPVFFTTQEYDKPRRINDKPGDEIKEVVLISGIANPKPLVDELSGKYKMVKHYKFSDHYNYQKRDLEKINQFIKKNYPAAAVVTTEKDAVKLRPLIEVMDFPVYELPVKVSFIRDEDKFNDLIRQAAVYKD